MEITFHEVKTLGSGSRGACRLPPGKLEMPLPCSRPGAPSWYRLTSFPEVGQLPRSIQPTVSFRESQKDTNGTFRSLYPKQDDNGLPRLFLNTSCDGELTSMRQPVQRQATLVARNVSLRGRAVPLKVGHVFSKQERAAGRPGAMTAGTSLMFTAVSLYRAQHPTYLEQVTQETVLE